MNILIIEDEEPLATDLFKTILAITPTAEIKAIIPSVEEGIEYLKQAPQLDLIFADIQLGDGLSFEIFEQTKNTIPIIFCTAYNQYALQAFDTMGIDYIIKPFSKENVAKAIEKFDLLKQRVVLPDFRDIIDTLKNNIMPAEMPSVIVYQGEKIIPVSGNDIALFYIRDNTVFAYTFQKEELQVNQTLEILEKKFETFFYRANRQFLINRKSVKSASQHLHRKIEISLTLGFGEPIIVGKEKVTDFLEWLSRN